MYKGESKINIKTLKISLRCREKLICILLNKYCAVRETSLWLLCVSSRFNDLSRLSPQNCSLLITKFYQTNIYSRVKFY